MSINLNSIKMLHGNIFGEREANRLASVSAFETLMSSSPTVYDVKLRGNDLTRNEDAEVCIVREKVEPTIKNLLYRLNLNISTGEYIYFNNEYYITFKRDRSTVGYNKREIEVCNNTLTFRDDLSGKVYEFPCIVGDKTSVYADGLAINQLNIISDDMISIVVPYNDIIAKIPSYGYRLVFNNSIVYSTTRKDMLTYKGIISFRAIFELNDERDDFENNIAYQNKKVSIDIKNEDDTLPSIEVTAPVKIRQGRDYVIELDIANSMDKEYEVEFYKGDTLFNEIEITNKKVNEFNIKHNLEDNFPIKMVVKLTNNPNVKKEVLIELTGRWG